MADVNRSLVMVFATEAGEKKTVTLNSPAEGLEGSDVSLQMDALVESGILATDNGVITQKVSAKFVVQTKTAVAVK